MNRWWEYVQHATGGATGVRIARALNISEGAVSKWRTFTPRPVTVVAFAKAFDRPVLEAFIGAGFISAEDAGQKPAAEPDLGRVPDKQLVEEVAGRLARAAEIAGERQPHFINAESEFALDPAESVSEEPYTPNITTGRGRRRTTAQPKSGHDGVTKGSEGSSSRT